MSGLTSVLQGSYSYLLVFQIAVVTVLLLTLILLIARRIRYAEVAATPEHRENVASEAALQISEEQMKEIEALREKISEMERDNADVVQIKEKNKAYAEKVKYLEQRLLEYEILQEEIGTLSHLKTENENLKKRIQNMGSNKRPDPEEESASE